MRKGLQGVTKKNFDEWVQQISKYKPHRREKKFKSWVRGTNGAKVRVRYKKGLFEIYCPKHYLFCLI